jgi:hypothetical protein
MDQAERLGAGELREALREQAGLGGGTSRLTGLLAATLTVGGDGFCVHATLETRPETRALLAVVRQTAACDGALSVSGLRAGLRECWHAGSNRAVCRQRGGGGAG